MVPKLSVNFCKMVRKCFIILENLTSILKIIQLLGSLFSVISLEG